MFSAISTTGSTTGVAITALVPLYAPYCPGGDMGALEQALSVLQQGQFNGVRQLQGGEGRAFHLQWSGAQAPLDPLSCELGFPQLPQVTYRFVLPAHHLVAWLAEAMAQGATQDLPDPFWSWLILGASEG
ncbi:MAG: transglycosylase [Cyanobacteriota bacterium]|nr:transglycosylase [Cyanobacteriota bacterium]